MSEPSPEGGQPSFREVVTKGEDRSFVVQAFDPQRRGIELALPGVAKLAGRPTAETVEAEIRSEVVPARPARRRKQPALGYRLDPSPPPLAAAADLVPVPTGPAPGEEDPAKPPSPGLVRRRLAPPPAKAAAAAKAPAKRAAKVAAATVEVPASQGEQGGQASRPRRRLPLPRPPAQRQLYSAHAPKAAAPRGRP